MSVDVTTEPLYLEANDGVYTAQALRQPLGDLIRPGVIGGTSFKVVQRAAGANLSVDVCDASSVNVAYVLGDSVVDQGVYRVPYSGAAKNIAVTANSSGNPRLDQVVLVIGDSAHAGGLDKAYLDVIAGTPTSGATLANRTGAGDLPESCLLLADVIVASGASSITTATIADKRAFAGTGLAVPRLKVTKSSPQSIVFASGVDVTYDTIVYDDLFPYVAGVTPVAPVDGVYEILSCLVFASNATGSRSNMINAGSHGPVGGQHTGANPISGGTTTIQAYAVTELAAGEAITVQAFQTSTGALNVVASDVTTGVKTSLAVTLKSLI